MKIIFVAHNASIEGSGLAFASLCREFSKRGVEVVAVVPRPEGVYDLVKDIENVRPVVIRDIKNEIYPKSDSLKDKVLFLPKLLRRQMQRAKFRKEFRELVRRERPDLIHTNVGTVRVPAMVAEEFGISHVWHVRECQKKGYDFKPFGGERKVSELYHRENNNCICITECVCDYYDLHRANDKVVYDGVFSKETADRLANLNVEKKKVILYVGLLSQNKGVPMLLEAFDGVADRLPGYELWLAGRDDLGMDAIKREMKHGDRVKYLGFRKDVYDLMAQARALVVPSNYEGFGFITAEAMLNHTLVIGRDSAGTKEQMDNGLKMKGEEIAMRFNTVEELEKRLLEAVSMPEEKYAEMTAKAFHVVSEMYTVERSAKDVLDFYEFILNKKKKER